MEHEAYWWRDLPFICLLISVGKGGKDSSGEKSQDTTRRLEEKTYLKGSCRLHFPTSEGRSAGAKGKVSFEHKMKARVDVIAMS